MTKSKMPLTLARVNELLTYCPTSGEFRWRAGPRSGQLAGALQTNGYRRIKIDGRLYTAHRLVWFIVNGNWPPEQIDHINGVKDDNRVANLRLATSTENMRNRGLRSDNSSGHVGVGFDGRRRKWYASIRLAGRLTHLGYFDTVEEAVSARHEAETKYFGAFRRPA